MDISPVRWPTKMHGHFFPRELHTFHPNLVKEEREYKRPPHNGLKQLKPIVIDSEAFNKVLKDFVESSKQHKFVPRWNPHNIEFPTPTLTSVSSIQISNIHKTRKARKHL